MESRWVLIASEADTVPLSVLIYSKKRLCETLNNSGYVFNTMLLELSYCFIIVVMVIAIVCINTVKHQKYTHCAYIYQMVSCSLLFRMLLIGVKTN